MKSGRLLAKLSALGLALSACSGQDGQPSTGAGGATAAGGTSSQGGTSGGAIAGGSAGKTGAGGAVAAGGTVGSGGATSVGGTTSGGVLGAGGSTGGAVAAGGQVGAGGSGVGGSTSTTGGMSGKGGAGGTTGMGGASAGGKTASGGTAAGGTAGMPGSGGNAGAGGAIPLGNPAVKSAGCGKATTLTSGKKTITSTGQQRSYIIDIPSNYDMNKPYRLFYTSHWIGSTSEAVRDQNYYFLKPLATAANQPAIFVAPQSDGATWQQKDHALFDDILAYVKQNLCIDTTRVFATGFSFGGMITYSLAANHQKDIRAAVGIAPANYNIYVPPKTHQPIAWMQTTGMSDGTCPWVNGNSSTQGAKYIAIEHATDNGCTVPATIPIWQSGNHVCYDFQGCKAEFPTKVCTFGGGHTNIAMDPNSSTNWIPQESWKFFTQF